jgi:alpha-glucosidase
MLRHGRVNTQITGDDPDWWRGAVIYQIYPRSFQDLNGDGVGDLAGITARLGHIADLGVDAIWVSPFFTSPMKDFGYDVCNFCDVDPLFGTLSDFDHLVAEAHRLGLKVIIDKVLSHTSDRHPWFQESRSSRDNSRADWYVWADAKPDGSPPNNWLSVFGGPAWAWDTTRCQYYLHNYLTEQPDLNFHNPEVRAAVLEQVRFWLERGVDGFRLDTVNYYFHSEGLEDNPPAPDRSLATGPAVNPYNYQRHLYDKSRPETPEFLKEIRRLLEEYPGTAALGEVGDAERRLQLMAEYTSGGRLQMCYSFEFLSARFGRAHFESGIRRFEAMAGDGWGCWAFSNHDARRHVSRWQGDGRDPVRFAKFCAALLLSLRGSVCLYQGEELGLPEAEIAFEDLQDPYGIRFWPEFRGRDGARTPMVWQADALHGGFSTGRPWLPVYPAHARLAVDRQQDDPRSVLSFYRHFLRFRKRHPALIRGSIELLDSDGDVLAFAREGEGERLVCAFNLGATAAEWTPPQGRRLTPLSDCGMNGTHVEDGKVHLPPVSAFFASTATAPVRKGEAAPEKRQSASALSSQGTV